MEAARVDHFNKRRVTRRVFGTIMSASDSQPPTGPPSNPEKAPEESSSNAAQSTDQAAMDTTPDKPAEETWEDIPEDIISLPTDDILTRIRLIDNDIKVCAVLLVLQPPFLTCTYKVMRSETLRLQHEQGVMKEKIRDNGEKIKQNKVLPYLVANVVEVSYPHLPFCPLTHP